MGISSRLSGEAADANRCSSSGSARESFEEGSYDVQEVVPC